MSIFGTIMSKVFGHHDAAAPAPSSPTSTSSTSTSPAPSGEASATPTPAGGAAAPAGGQSVDVAAVLDGMEGHAGQTLDWRHSIVDLMKLLRMDSSLSARKQLAQELHYSGDTEDSAAMNIWLHKEVMAKFAANGGKLPADLH